MLPENQTPLSSTISQSLLKIMSIESTIYLTNSSFASCFSFYFQCFPASESFPLSQFFGSCGKVLELQFSFSISASNKYSGLISFKIDWFDLLAVQRTLKTLLQYKSSKASILWCSAYFMVQLSHLNVTPGKPIALTIQTFVGKVMSLLFNMLSRFITDFVSRSNTF